MRFFPLYPRLRFALLWPVLAALGVAAPMLWYVMTGPLEEGAATLLLDTLEIVWPQAAAVLEQEPIRVQETIRNLTAASNIRITLIEGSGRVIADSSLSWDEVPDMDDHGTRPEVRTALATGQGTAVRLSTTTGTRYAYAARTFIARGDETFVLRLARPVRQVRFLRRNLAGTMTLAAVTALVVLGPVSWWLRRQLFQPLQDIINGAGRLAAGELSTRVTVPAAQELGILAESLNRLADEVETQLALLGRERDHLREILASMSEGVLVANADGRIEGTNAALRRIFDLHGELEGLVSAEISPPVGELISAVVAENQPQSHELDHADKNLSLQVSPLPRGQGVVAVVRDMTAILRLAESRKDLVANVSHELKTPLTAIRGYAETLRDGALDRPEVARRFTRSILEQCARLEDLLRDLLTLSRLESERPRPSLETVDLGELARRAIEVLVPRARRHEIEISLSAADDLPAIAGQRDELERLLLNLIENAVKYNRPGGEVRIRLDADADELGIEVEDDGIGIPEGALDRIFERFYRVDKGRTRDQGGTGLGLSIVKHVAQNHGGRIEISSRLGKGSVFRVRLPRSHQRTQ